jgi:hypothetical protein
MHSTRVASLLVRLCVAPVRRVGVPTHYQPDESNVLLSPCSAHHLAHSGACQVCHRSVAVFQGEAYVAYLKNAFIAEYGMLSWMVVTELGIHLKVRAKAYVADQP